MILAQGCATLINKELVMNYVLIMSPTIFELHKLVNEAISDGYIPTGGITSIDGALVQPMVKKEVMQNGQPANKGRGYSK
jgi:hypothetical protein